MMSRLWASDWVYMDEEGLEPKDELQDVVADVNFDPTLG